MATMQPYQGMAQPSQNILPPNLTREQLQQYLQQYQTMKNQNVPEDDPIFVKLRNILMAVKQQTHLKQLQQQQQAQQARQQQTAAQQQMPQQNGASPAMPGASLPQDSANKSMTGMATNGTAPTSADGAPPASAQSDVAKTTPASKPVDILSKDQVALLKVQIQAFKCLTKNMALPQNLRQMLFAPRQNSISSLQPEINAPVSDANAAPAPAQSIPPPKTATPVVPEKVVPKGYQTFTSPWSLPLVKARLSYSQHGMRSNRPQIPSLMPLGMDLSKLTEERENILYNRLITRKAELENTYANIGTWNAKNNGTYQYDDAIKRKALIEYKKLCLLPKQRAMRQHLAREMLSADNLSMTANRGMYRRQKKQSLREARITEKLEKNQREVRETKEKQKHNSFLRSIEEHRHELFRAAHQHQQRVQRMGRAMITQHQNLEKEEQKRIERTAKQRLQALKANDEETYLRLLGQAKDTRISHLLNQTDGFLSELAASVKAQQKDARNRTAEVPEEEEADEELGDGQESGPSKIDYYEVAHRIKEEVTQQADMLVGGKLKEYQVKGLQWMISLYNNNLNGILADEMGLGKTIQTISLVTYLIEKKKEAGPYLVIVPLSTLTNWTNEFEKWAPSVAKIVYKGAPNARKAMAQQIRWGQFQVLLTTYEFIIKDRPILSKVKWLHMIVDEGHRMKNAGSKLSSTITQYYNTRYRLILTGTPLQNSLPELWALLNFVLPKIFKSVKSFDEWFNTPFANTGGQDKMELTEEEQLLVIKRLHKVLRPFLLRRLKKDVEKDLPDKQERVVKCNFSALQQKLYKQLLTHNRLMVGDGKGGKTGLRGLSNMLMQLRKLCNHPFVFDEVEEQMNPGKGNNDMLWRTAGKFELLDRILPKFQATGHRVLMFFQMTQIMNIMEDFLRLRGISYLRLDGSTKADDRSELLRVFNAPDSPYFMFLLSTRAGGLGLNLQTADTVIIYDSDWNPHQDLQAQDRAHRIGQKNEVRILRLISSNSVEEKILERANFKLDMDGKVIQAGRFDNKSNDNERDAMLRVMLETAEAAENLEERDDEMDDDDLNLIMARKEGEFELFQKMDEERIKSQKYGPGKKFPRLLCEAELPDIYVNEDGPEVDEKEEEITGRGARERTRVRYDDGLTEEQWLEAVDNSDDDIEEAIARKDAKKERRAVNKDKKMGRLNGDSPMPSRDSSEEPEPEPEPEPQPKKRGRKKQEKRKADDASLDGDNNSTPVPPKKRGRQAKITDPLAPKDREVLQTILDTVYEDLLNLEEKSSDPALAPRPLIDPFIELPPKHDYPDYYQFIKDPICMNNVKRKINRKEYTGLGQFRRDISLLCANCRQYNEDGSMLYLDANVIEETAIKRLRDETVEHPELRDFELGTNGSGGDVGGSGPVSSAGTPGLGAR